MSKLYDIALTYIGTPHINGGNVKNAGLDCCTLITSIYKDIGWIDIEIDYGYTSDWFCKRECKEMILPYLERYFIPVTDLKVGDVIGYRWGRSKVAHLSLYLGDNKVIHSQADIGTEITDFDNPYFSDRNGSRINGIWRLKNVII